MIISDHEDMEHKQYKHVFFTKLIHLNREILWRKSKILKTFKDLNNCMVSIQVHYQNAFIYFSKG